jgi:hypothetical protein
MTISKATLNDVAELTALVNTAYRGKESLKSWAAEAHIAATVKFKFRV